MGSTVGLTVPLRVLPPRWHRHLRALHHYAAWLDALDEQPLDRPAALDRFEAELRDMYAGRPVRHPVLRVLAPTVAERRLPLAPFLDLIRAHRVDQRVASPTFADVVAHCRLSANPLGRLVLHVFGQAAPAHLELSDRICTGLRLTEHLRDLAADHQRRRIYLPEADLDRFGVVPDDIGRPVATGQLRELVGYAAERARALLEAGAPLVAGLTGWGRLVVSRGLAEGRATLDALAEAGYDPLSARIRPGRSRIAARWLAATVRTAG
ncbi:MAG: squalene/phytoene synthase family protein [Micromonosporaceae bacterium]